MHLLSEGAMKKKQLYQVIRRKHLKQRPWREEVCDIIRDALMHLYILLFKKVLRDVMALHSLKKACTAIQK